VLQVIPLCIFHSLPFPSDGQKECADPPAVHPTARSRAAAALTKPRSPGDGSRTAPLPAAAEEFKRTAKPALSAAELASVAARSTFFPRQRTRYAAELAAQPRWR